MAKPLKPTENIYTCSDCTYSYDPYNLDWENKPIMCKCKNDKYSKLLSQKSCGKFKKK